AGAAGHVGAAGGAGSREGAGGAAVGGQRPLRLRPAAAVVVHDDLVQGQARGLVVVGDLADAGVTEPERDRGRSGVGAAVLRAAPGAGRVVGRPARGGAVGAGLKAGAAGHVGAAGGAGSREGAGGAAVGGQRPLRLRPAAAVVVNDDLVQGQARGLVVVGDLADAGVTEPERDRGRSGVGAAVLRAAPGAGRVVGRPALGEAVGAGLKAGAAGHVGAAGGAGSR